MIKKRAFSLVEILVVVAIIGIIALVGIPAFSKFYQMYKMRTVMNQLVNDIRAARQEAITSGFPVKLTFIDATLYPQMKGITGGYAIYRLQYPRIDGDGDASGTDDGAETGLWREVVPPDPSTPAHPYPLCGERAKKPRFFPFPVSILDADTDLLDVDKDSIVDLVFLSDGSVYRGPYPADGSGTPANLTFTENTTSLPTAPDAAPRIILQTPAKITFDRYCISFSLFGKIAVQHFHS
jgi:prepilin-type N-terminal cleavage/methylation domain-containing protein